MLCHMVTLCLNLGDQTVSTRQFVKSEALKLTKGIFSLLREHLQASHLIWDHPSCLYYLQLVQSHPTLRPPTFTETVTITTGVLSTLSWEGWSQPWVWMTPCISGWSFASSPPLSWVESCPPQIHICPQAQNRTLCRQRVFAGVRK